MSKNEIKSTKLNQGKKRTLLIALLDVPKKRIEVQKIKNGIIQQKYYLFDDYAVVSDFIFFDSIHGQYSGNNFFELRDDIMVYSKMADIDRNQARVLGNDKYVSMDSIGEAYLYNHTFKDERTVFIYDKSQFKNNGMIKFNQRQMIKNTSPVKYLLCPEVTDYYGKSGTSYLRVFNSIKNQIFTFDSTNYSGSTIYDYEFITNNSQVRDHDGILSYLKYKYNRDRSGVSEVHVCKYNYIENTIISSYTIKINGGHSSDNYYHFIDGNDVYIASDKTIFYVSDGVASDTIFHTNELEILDFYVYD